MHAVKYQILQFQCFLHLLKSQDKLTDMHKVVRFDLSLSFVYCLLIQCKIEHFSLFI